MSDENADEEDISYERIEIEPEDEEEYEINEDLSKFEIESKCIAYKTLLHIISYFEKK